MICHFNSRFEIELLEVDNVELDRVENDKSTRCGLVQLVTNTVFQKGWLSGTIVAGDADFGAEVIDCLWGEATATESGQSKQSRIIPVSNESGIDKTADFTF